MKKIKIVFIQDKLVCGGAEQALFDLANLLDREKFDITVLVQKPGGPWDQKFRDGGVNVIYDYSCRKATINPVVKARNISRKLRTAAAYRRNGEGLLDVVCPGADIIVSYSMWDHALCGFAQGAKSVKFIHGNMQTNEQFRNLILRDEKLLPRYSRIVCVSQAAWAAFVAVTGRRDGVEMHFNPIDSDAVCRKAEQPVSIPNDLPVICAVGRLAKEKGFERLIVIHQRLVEQGIAHRLVIVGDGPDRDYIRRIVKAVDAQDTVILAGYQENPYPYMKNSRFVVCSSFTEGLPVIAMEALCMGVPVVAAVPAVGEAFGDEPCGLITENDNASLMEGIRRALTDEEFYCQMKAAAQRRSAFFSGKRMVREIEDMFLQMMQED
ncbi:MAG: glycosyltransferase [Eubacteriales bacterium]|nr:glycosyltransferase [Eubacteriales bacterium]